MAYDGFVEDDFATWRGLKADLYTKIEGLQQGAAGLPSHSVDPKKFVFRGQGCKSCGLETSFDRRYRKLLAAGSLDIDNEYNAMFASFLEDCRYYGFLDEVPATLVGKPEAFLE